MSDKLRQILQYVGFISAVITGIMYLLVVIVMVVGVKSTLPITERLLFSVIGAVVGILINYFLREQGIIFARDEPESIVIMDAYYKAINATKSARKLHTINRFRWLSLTKDIVLKGASVIGGTFGILYIFVAGSGDISLIILAIANFMLFVTFGIFGTEKAYNTYKKEHLSVIIELTRKLNEQALIPVERDENGIYQ